MLPVPPPKAEEPPRKGTIYENLFSVGRRGANKAALAREVSEERRESAAPYYDVKSSSVGSVGALSRTQRMIQVANGKNESAGRTKPFFKAVDGTSAKPEATAMVGKRAGEEIAQALNQTIEDRVREIKKTKTIDRKDTLTSVNRKERAKSPMKTRTVEPRRKDAFPEEKKGATKLSDSVELEPP